MDRQRITVLSDLKFNVNLLVALAAGIFILSATRF